MKKEDNERKKEKCENRNDKKKEQLTKYKKKER